jgi:hypothetical protein
MTSQVFGSGRIDAMCVRLLALAGAPPSTPRIKENWIGGSINPISRRGDTFPIWPVSKHSHSGFTPTEFIFSSKNVMSEKGFAKTKSKMRDFRLLEYFA